jgi:beta-lactamase regulating signal transducer with metallopeptidase domain
MNLLATWLIGGLLVAAGAALAVRLIPSASPAQRHAFWWLALAIVLAFPWLPELAGALSLHRVAALADSQAGPVVSLLRVPAPPPWLGSAALALWVALTTASLLELALGLHAVSRLARSARPLAVDRAGRLERFNAARAGSRPARAYVSADVSGACALGFFRPRILLSADLVATLDREGIEAIVLHEYAHLQRYDDWTRLLQKVVLAFAGLHPAVRWVSRHIDIEREAACDRMVVARTGAPVAYARSLTFAAEIAGRMSGFTPAVSPGAFVGRAGLHARVSRVIAEAPVRPAAAWAASIAGVAGLAGASVFALSMPPIVTVATLESPLDSLTSTPVSATLMRDLRATSRPDRTDSAPAAVNHREVDIAAPSAPVERDTMVDAVRSVPIIVADAAIAPVTHEPAVAAGNEQPAVLPSSALVPGFAAPAGRSAPDARPSTGDGVGNGAARFGVATGEAAANAGLSIGRFFSKGGQAIASRF